MANRKDRIILDTNLWISFLLTKDFYRIDAILKSKQAVLLFSQELLEEFAEVIKRPKLKKYFSDSDVESLLTTIDEVAEFVIVQSVVSICRDPKDNFLLELAKDGEASHLLTGDKDPLEIKKFGKTRILKITEYLK